MDVTKATKEELIVPPVTTIPKWCRLLGLAIVIFACCLPFLLIVLNAVNVPYGDEYVLNSITNWVRTHSFPLAEWWAPHNEHRILIPRLLFMSFIGLLRMELGRTNVPFVEFHDLCRDVSIQLFRKRIC